MGVGNTGQEKNIGQGETGWKDYTRKDWETEARVCSAYVPWERSCGGKTGVNPPLYTSSGEDHECTRGFRMSTRIVGGWGVFGHVYIWALFSPSLHFFSHALQ